MGKAKPSASKLPALMFDDPYDAREAKAELEQELNETLRHETAGA